MSAPRRWSRRRFLQSAVGSSAAIAAVGLAGGAWPRTAGDGTLSSRLATVLASRDSAIAIGRAYLADTPGEADRDTLTSILIGRLPERAGAPVPVPDADLRRRIDVAVREDFARGDIVRVRGWLLSTTEARLCAVVALDDRSSGT